MAHRLDPFGSALALAHVNALILPHPAMTAAQCELLCAREGLALAHLGRARLVLVQTSGRPQTMLRIEQHIEGRITAADGRRLAREIREALAGREPDHEAA